MIKIEYNGKLKPTCVCVFVCVCVCKRFRTLRIPRLPLYISQDDEALKALLKNTIANLVERLMIVDDDRAAAGQRRLYQAPRLPAQQEQFGNKKRDKVMWDKYMKGDNNNLAYDSMVMAQM